MKLEITEPAQKDFANLDRKTQRRIRAALDRLLTYPQAVDLKKLQSSPGEWRLRVGDWRVIFRIEREQELLYILRVRHRREAYR
ncbi:MAG: type II toxin-antitoxin system RelE/ParE family toxin [Syntrophothermus sp.]|uniref:type II toxin-antitoxin system RelE family toxin n=1 Tax=Syntrophothermus sp. TaxID=2736299 RepID=UPI00257CCBD9|nr:type II toxin-antitoxin system RelE/ParE family toxin [Syntrophothermus sp.]NSW84640.1 type II toxin-antitoxin system RelE/ParE family toxin [Syntrophothermus sp.]